MTDGEFVFCPAEFFDSFDETCPQPAYRDLATTSPCVRPDGLPVVGRKKEIRSFNRHAAVRATDGVHFKLGGRRPLIPLEIDGPEHAKYRRILDPLFSPKAVAPLIPTVRKLANQLIDQFVESESVALYETFCRQLPSRVFIKLLGLPEADLPKILGFIEAAVRPDGVTREDHEEFRRATGESMYSYLTGRVAEKVREAETGRDLLGNLLAASVDGEYLAQDTVVDICYLLVIAGIETVISSLSCIFAWLAQHPEKRRRLVAEPDVLPTAIEELMRYESPVPLIWRWVAEDIVVDGRRWPAGTTAQVVWAAANVDPDAYDDPLTIDFDRQRNDHFAFGSGRHRCLGSHLARMQIRVAVEEFHRRIPEYQITPGERVRYTNNGIRAATHLPMTLHGAWP